MIKIPYERIVELIKESGKISEEELNSRIQAKLDQLSGLISKEGAAHIVANELGVKLMEQGSGKLQIKNILSGMRNVEVLGKVLAVYEIREFTREGKAGKVGSFLVGDETGLIRVTCWHDQTDKMKDLQKDDVVKITNAYARDNQGRKELSLNDQSDIVINPKGEDVGEVAKPKPAERKRIADLQEADNGVELLATVVQVFDLRFFEVCPQCKKRARPRDAEYACEQHGIVAPDYGYVLNLFIDDGSENIRAVFFREQIQQLLGKNHEQILHFREIPETFDEAKHELLGQIVRLTGKVTKNSMFDRLEFNVFRAAQADPEEELRRLDKEKSDSSTPANSVTNEENV